MTTVTSVPLSGLNSFGTIKTTGVQAHTIRQISVINAPNLTGSDGDLVIDSGDTSRTNNGKLKVKGGLSGDTKTEVLETGVWDSALSVGILTNTTTTAQTISDHVAAGTLLTGLKIPILGGNSMDPNKVYTLRNVGNSGHVAWGTVNDLGGNITISGGLSVSSDVFLAQNLSCGGNYTLDGAATVGSTLSVNGAVVLDATVSIGASCDITNAIRVGGASLLNGTLSVNSTVFLGGTLDVTGAFTAESESVLKSTLSVSGDSTFNSHVSVTGDVNMNDLEIRGRILPLSDGLSIGSLVVVSDDLSVSGLADIGSHLSIGGDLFVGSTLSITTSEFTLNTPSLPLNVTADSTFTGSSTFNGFLSVGNSSAALFDTPLLSVSGLSFLGSDVDVTGDIGISSGISCGSGVQLGGSLTVGQAATVTSSVVVGTTLSVGGEVTIEGNLNVQGTTTTINSATLTVEDKTIELGVVATPTDVTATGAGVIIKGSSDKEILYTRSSDTSNSTQQLSAFQISEDIVLDKKTKPFNDTLVSRLATSERSQVVHLGDLASTDGHWMIVADISNGKLQFWYGQDIPDDSAMESVPSSAAKLAFEIQKPT